MKHIPLISVFLLFTLVNTSTTIYGESPVSWGNYKPVFMKRADLEKSVSYQAQGRNLVNPGKIYSQAPYLYINERYRGIHVINNTDPAHPVNEGFIVVPGCIDLAMKGHILYVDNSVDLVAFDLESKTVTKRVKNVFPSPSAPDDSYYGYREDDMVLVEWRKIR
jgi:hypothetical protein